jgi:hypothetical protein
MSASASKLLFNSIVEMDIGLAEGLVACLTAADRYVALMENQGVEPRKLAAAKAGLATAREAANALERDAHVLARVELLK